MEFMGIRLDEAKNKAFTVLKRLSALKIHW
jgi:hypothetical protein